MARSAPRKGLRHRAIIALLWLIGPAVLVGATPAVAADPVIMAAGDIACPNASSASPGGCSDAYTANLARSQRDSGGLAALLALGDTQYDQSTLAEFNNVFNNSWGASDLRGILRPVPGNHEYLTGGASGYFQYFAGIGVGAGASGKGWYSYNIGTWHFVGLNSSDGCQAVSCAAGSEQESWLKADLAAATQPCKLVYWHHPLKTAPAERAIWQDMYNAGVDFVLTGHIHGWTPPEALDPNGNANSNGPREAIVGTGGKDGSAFGLLKMTLHANSTDWNFVGTASNGSGSATCRGRVAPPPAPPPPPPPAKPATSFNTTVSGMTASFTDTSTNAPTGWVWDFGDGTGIAAGADPTPNPSHTYARPGTYTVKLTASNAGGAGPAAFRQVTVPDGPGGPSTTVPPGTELAPVDPGTTGVQGAVATRLTAAQARAALRSQIAKRLRRWKITRLTCTPSRKNVRLAHCTFRAARHGKVATGRGTVTAYATVGKGSFNVKVRISGRQKRTQWHGRITV